MSNKARDLLSADPGPHIEPSLLECDFTRLREVLAETDAAGVKMYHLDVMDGHFVPNLTYGPPLIRQMRKATERPFDAHLMIANPDKYVDEYCEAGCDIVTIHIETNVNHRAVIDRIHAHGSLAGIALNPPTSLDAVKPLLEVVDLVLVMSVMPGFGGQKFDATVLEKFRWLRSHGPKGLNLQGDGGVNASTISQIVQAGANLLVVGSALFRAGNFKSALQSLQKVAVSC